jgi:hypothetical protein
MADGQTKAYRQTTGDELVPATVPLELHVVEKILYFPRRRPLEFLSLFKSPVFIVMGFTLLMTMCMPRLLRSLDPEIMKELQGLRRERATPASS